MSEAGEVPPKKRGRPFSQSGPLRSRINLRGSDRWDEWLTLSAARLGVEKAGVIDLALAALARERGLDPPPSRYHDA